LSPLKIGYGSLKHVLYIEDSWTVAYREYA
jgi:hypothetical protein